MTYHADDAHVGYIFGNAQRPNQALARVRDCGFKGRYIDFRNHRTYIPLSEAGDACTYQEIGMY